jgi:hypothetical protein
VKEWGMVKHIEQIRNIFICIELIGLILLSISIISYHIRVKDYASLKRFWLKKDLLSKKEYLMNRIGFGISIAGFVYFIGAFLMLFFL